MTLADFLDAHAIAMPEPTPVTVWPAPGRLATVGQRAAVRWVDFFARPLETSAPRDTLPAWSPATFRDDRRGIAHHEQSTALALDLDAHTPAAVLFARLREIPFASHAHTSSSATADALRWRIVFDLDGPATEAEHVDLWRWGSAALDLPGVDGAPKHAASIFYVPVRRPGGLYLWRSFPGFPVTVADVVAAMAPAPRAVAAPPRRAYRAGPCAVERARRYLERMPGAVAGQHGHDATFRAALVVVVGFGLPDAEALALLGEWNATCDPPWSERELARKVREAREHGRLPDGFLLNDERRRA
jgi:hypothetical protein